MIASSDILIPNKALMGTNGHIVTGIAYKIENKWHRDRGLPSSLDAESNQKDGRIYRSNYQNDNAYWYLSQMSQDSYKIENKWHRDRGLPSSLDADSNQKDGRIYCSNYQNDNTSWYLSQMSIYSFKIENKWHRDKGKPSSLDAESNQKNGRIYRSNYENDNTSWYFSPMNYELQAVVADFQYEKPPDAIFAQHNKNVDLIEKRLIKNNADIELTDIIMLEKTITNKFSFTFKESLSFIAKTVVQAEIPFLASTKAEFSLSLGFEANQQLTKSEAITIPLSKQVKVPAFTSVEIGAYVNCIENTEMPFKAIVKIIGLANRSKTDNTVVKMAQVDSEGVYSFLLHNKFQGAVIGCEGNTVLARLNGTFMGSYGLGSEFCVDKI